MSRQEKVRIVVEANTEAAKAVGAALNDAFQKAGQGAEQAGKKGRKSFDDMIGGADKFLMKMLGVQGAMDLVLKSMKAIIDTQSQLRQESVSPVAQMDTGIRRYLATAGVGEGQYGAAQSRMMALAKTYAVPFDTTAALAEQLVSSGVPHASVMGGGLEAVMQGYVAMNQVGMPVDPRAHARGLGLLTTSMGLETTPENLARVNRALFVAKSEGNVEIEQLPEVANRAGTIRQFAGLNVEEYMASMAMLSRRGGTQEMATSFKNVVMSLATAQTVPEKVRALREVGMKPSDVDMVGESLFDVMGLLQSKVGALPKDQQNRFFGRMFGEKTIMSIPAFMEGMGEIAEFGKKMQGGGGMGAAVRMGAGGNAAMLRRTELEELEAQAAGGFIPEMARRQRSAARRKALARGEMSYGDFIVAEKADDVLAGARDIAPVLDRNTAAIEALNKRLEGMERGVPVHLKEDIQAPPAQPARRQENLKRSVRGAVPMVGGGAEVQRMNMGQ